MTRLSLGLTPPGFVLSPASRAEINVLSQAADKKLFSALEQITCVSCNLDRYHGSAISTARQAVMDPRVQTLVRLIEHDFEKKHSYGELAEIVNLSESRVRHLFKAEVGMSIGSYRNLLRMQRAKELIETSFLSIKQIRNELGLTDKGRFAQRFRRAYGVTPSQYRDEHFNLKITTLP